MKFGIALGSVRSRQWTEVTELADRLGYDSVWMPEHLVLPVDMGGSPFEGAAHPPVPPNIPVFDVFTYLGFLAARTERIRFSTHVYNIGLRHPFVVARAVTTLDVISGGRAEFGVGASWLEAEWAAVGLDFKTRGRRVDEALAVCQKLWTEDVIEHHGEFFDFDPVMFQPKPTQKPWPPINIGGDGPAALRRAATVGDGWIPMNHSVDDIGPAIERLQQLRSDAGRPGRTTVTFGATPDYDEARRLADLGIDRVLVRPWGEAEEPAEGLQRYAEEVVHRVPG
jgi:probable F420-dependent oxidoreductase